MAIKRVIIFWNNKLFVIFSIHVPHSFSFHCFFCLSIKLCTIKRKRRYFTLFTDFTCLRFLVCFFLVSVRIISFSFIGLWPQALISKSSIICPFFLIFIPIPVFVSFLYISVISVPFKKVLVLSVYAWKIRLACIACLLSFFSAKRSRIISYNWYVYATLSD